MHRRGPVPLQQTVVFKIEFQVSGLNIILIKP